MYYVTYYINKQPHRYEFAFKSLWAAIFKARAILEQHGLATDVMQAGTGEILAVFEPDHTEINTDLEIDLQVLALQPLE